MIDTRMGNFYIYKWQTGFGWFFPLFDFLRGVGAFFRLLSHAKYFGWFGCVPLGKWAFLTSFVPRAGQLPGRGVMGRLLMSERESVIRSNVAGQLVSKYSEAWLTLDVSFGAVRRWFLKGCNRRKVRILLRITDSRSDDQGLPTDRNRGNTTPFPQA